MNMFLLNLSLTLVAIAFIQCQTEFGVDWSYKPVIFDEENWTKKWENCGGKKQSPIDIDTKKLRPNSYLRLNLSSYDTPRKFIMRNTGGSVELVLYDKRSPIVIYTDKDQDTPYVFEKMTIHWGESDNTGSEHRIDGQSQVGEIQFAHFNKKYKTFEAAKGESDGIVYLGLILRYDDSTSGYNHAIFKLIAHSTYLIEEYGSKIVDNRVVLGDMLPENRNHFYSYWGSLTYPPCTENIAWFIFADMSNLYKALPKRLREMKDRKGEGILSNYRKIQPTNRRVVFNVGS